MSRPFGLNPVRPEGLEYALARETLLERARRFERPTLTLARLCSTPELRPHPLGEAEIPIPAVPCKREIRLSSKFFRFSFAAYTGGSGDVGAGKLAAAIGVR